MADQLQLRGGPTAQSEIFVGAEREITVDTGLKRLRIHDGVTPGGHLLNGKADLDSAIATINQTIDDYQAADAQARLDLKVLLEQELADQETVDAAARAVLQAAIEAEVTASAAHDIVQDNRLAFLEVASDINKKELNYITLVFDTNPAPGQVGVGAYAPSDVEWLVLPVTDIDGNTIEASDFIEGDRIALKQPSGSAAIFTIDDAFVFGDHIRMNVDMVAPILGAAGDQVFTESAVTAVFEDNSVDRAASTAGFTAASDARAVLQGLIDALEARADALEVDPTTATALAAVQADVDANELASDNAETALSGRLDTLEADSTTATAVAAVQADVDANETASDAAEAALSGRLDVLEADPTTKTYVDTQVAGLVDSAPGVLNTLDELAAALGDDANFASTITNSIAAVQLDVDNNETASDAAEAALSTRLDTLEADPTTATAVAAVQADVDANEVSRKDVIEFDSNLTQVKNSLRSTYINIGNNIELRPAAAGGRVEVSGDLLLDASDLVNANNDTDAGNAGTPVGGVYHHNGALRIRLS